MPSFNNVTLLPSEQATAQEIDRYFRLELIYKRNERMGRRVRTLLEENPDKSFFFAFGAGGWASSNVSRPHACTHTCTHTGVCFTGRQLLGGGFASAFNDD